MEQWGLESALLWWDANITHGDLISIVQTLEPSGTSLETLKYSWPCQSSAAPLPVSCASLLLELTAPGSHMWSLEGWHPVNAQFYQTERNDDLAKVKQLPRFSDS